MKKLALLARSRIQIPWDLHFPFELITAEISDTALISINSYALIFTEIIHRMSIILVMTY